MRSQGQAAGSQLVDSLNGLVEELIKENKRLQRQVEKLTSRGPGTAAAGLERGLKAIQKRIERTLASAAGKTTPARRRTVAKVIEANSKAGSVAPAARSRRKPDAPTS